MQTSILKHNQMVGKIETATKHRKEIFKEVIYYVKSMKEPVCGVIGEDCNQDIESNEVKRFFAELKLQEAHRIFNEVKISQMYLLILEDQSS